MLTTGDILNSISNSESLQLFSTIALTGGNASNLVNKLNLTRKQYYSKMARLLKTGLIKKHGSDFCLTTFGVTIYEILDELRLISDRYWTSKMRTNYEDLVGYSRANGNANATIGDQDRSSNQADLELIEVTLPS
jgi:predicted transcriptional regulator